MHQEKAVGSVFALLLCLAAGAGCGDGDDDSSTGEPCSVGPVTTASGAVCGTTAATAGNTARAFLGIPYAETTAGANRWEAPLPKTAWRGNRQATAFGNVCPQNGLPLGAASSRAPGVGDAGLPPQSEDCLSLNVWTPAGAGPGAALPVLVYVHGGFFTEGASAEPQFDGTYIAATQVVVVVTINYRLGVLGFLAGVAGRAGNYGFLDQQLALRWVRDNIGNFGGDPANVTIFGESAGAMSVGLHLLSAPGSVELFEAAIMESNPFALPYKTPEQARLFSTFYRQFLRCDLPDGGLGCMKAAPVEDVLRVQANLLVQLLPILENVILELEGIPPLIGAFEEILVWAPVVDGEVITEQPVLAASRHRAPDKPTILGTNKNEGVVFIFGFLDALRKAVGLDIKITKAEYVLLLTQFFGPDNLESILKEYPPEKNDNAAALSRVVTDYLFACANRFVADQAPVQSSSYIYEFTKVSSFNVWKGVPQCKEEVCHGDEEVYVFHTADNLGFAFTAAEAGLSDDMVAYWANFGFPGHDPNGTGLPVWPAFAAPENYIILDTPISIATDPPHHCDLWDHIGYDLDPLGALTGPPVGP